VEEQSNAPLQKGEAIDTEFKYIVQVRAFETFRNTLRREGLAMPETVVNNLSFASSKRLDMKSYKARGLIWSYSIIRVRKVEDVIEED
jgi:hypothetical protein